MSEFLGFLAQWRGRSYVQLELEARGFLIPRRYQEFVATQCSAGSRHDLDLYWSEHARERVCSGGGANSYTREFHGIPSYRSEYLDKLAASRKSNPPFRTPPLHPCLLEFATKSRLDPAFDPKTIELIERHKAPEIAMRSDRFRWTGEKRDAGRIFSELMREKGYDTFKSKRHGSRTKVFVKQSDGGAIFGGWSDAGGRPFCIAVPFYFFVADSLSMQTTFDLSFDVIVPGFWHYYRFDSVKSAILGFQAHVEMIDVMFHSFGHGQA